MKTQKLTGKDYLLSVQHLFAMFGATVLVPLLTGMNASLALFTAGLGTLIFHVLTKFKVPVFLGSSFAFLPAIMAITLGENGVIPSQVPVAQGGIIAAGAVYVIFAVIVFLVGTDKIKKLFPPVVTGPVIIVIGIGLSSTAINDSLNNAYAGTLTGEVGAYIGIAVFTLAVVIGASIFAKGFFKLVPILIGIAAGYILCVILKLTGAFDIVDFTAIKEAPWINIPFKSADANGVAFMSLPKFELGAILSIAPVAIVTFMEHIGDITTNGMVVGKDFFSDPGLHRTLLGDGIATGVAGFFGGPPNTTYSENTGVLATTKNYNPALLRVTAIFAIILGFVGKFGAVLQTIPSPVKGGVELVLFGMIAAIGIRTLAEAKLDFTHSRNLLIVALILVLGLGLNAIGGLTLAVGTFSFNLSGLFVAVIIGVSANAVLPDEGKAKK
ncbi:MAG: uracil-xanthine permease family protein [Oscillospiraceae bacterium]|jgi:uracil permease|nr:uracil-xanthine permease family protein [Oscillospiraceae bacterium]